MGVSGSDATRFSSTRQPDKKKVGRPKNIFGPLGKENNLSNDDIKKIFKNLLRSKPEDLNKVVEKYPTVLTIATANILAQEMRGELTGRWESTGRKIPELDKNDKPKLDTNGNPIMTNEMRPERHRSYDMVRYMIERCFGKPIHQVILDSIDRTEFPADPEERRILAEKLRNELGLGKLPSGAVLPGTDQKTENADTE
jgi:hypothetical protein